MENIYDIDNAPYPCLNTKKGDIDNNMNINEQKEIVIQLSDDAIFSIMFTKKINNIEIECNNILSEEEKYTNSLNIKDWNKLNIFSKYDNINDIYNEIKKLDDNNISLKKQQDKILLTITLLNKYSSDILLSKNNNNLNNFNDFDAKFEEPRGNQIMDENKNLKIEKNNLEKRVEKLEKYIDFIEKNMPINYINKIISSMPYNSFDDSLYELDNVYQSLQNNSLIKNKRYLGLINIELKKIFKNNINKCNLCFKFSYELINPYESFKSAIDSLINILIVIRTINDNIFGFFYVNNNDFDMNNNINNNINYGSNIRVCKKKRKTHKIQYGYQKKNNNNKTVFFNSEECFDNSVAFSFSNLKVYNKQDRMFPDCYIYYDLNKLCLQGKEICNNSKYQINGTPEFVISQFEVYEII